MRLAGRHPSYHVCASAPIAPPRWSGTRDVIFNQQVAQPERLERMLVDQLDATFAALADPTRRAILERLAANHEATVNELAEPFPITLQAVYTQLRGIRGS